ncbi:hypothetical protein MLD38_033751 [Melastoma candidum]|uniref:Uncharacterized protein n=1 Tax=Melastoma candidum TaxID=119954 RepID=A0ACB9M9W4_9MYRT|nr:hypothetical protein MLD38_033751 [Melastoma candidum]
MQDLKPSTPNSSPLTPILFLERASLVYGDSPSVVYGEDSPAFTWSQTHLRCLQLASSLSSLGIGPGHVASVIAPNVPAMYELHFAVPMSGAVLNCINTRLDARTVSVLLLHSESRILFVDVQSKGLVRDALSLLPSSHPCPFLVLIEDEVGYPSPASAVDVDFYSTYECLVARGDPEFEWIRPSSEWDPMILNYTSGTTSSPKGVVHCHRGIFLVTVNLLIDWDIPKQPVYLWTLPMFHANGWCFPWAMAAVGGVNVCIRKFDADIIHRLINAHRVTHMCGAPVVLNMITSLQKPLPHPVHIITSGAPPPAAVLCRTESLGFIVGHGYGLTETAGHVALCVWKGKWNVFPASERARLKARQGVRTTCFEKVEVVDPNTGISVKHDGKTQGEIVLHGGHLMLGYLKDPEGTARSMKNGYFYTGDVGVIHPDGYIEIKDRSKDVIISGGENLSSVEMETILYGHPAVKEVAVVARPDEYWGEMPCAFVSLKEGQKAPTEKEMIEYCRERMPRYMVPKTVVFRDELPKTSTGKIQKFILRELAKQLGPSRVSRM